MMNFLKKAFSEQDGTPSSNRVMLAILLLFTMNMIAVAFYMSGKLPEIPASLLELIKWLFAFLAGGVWMGKVKDGAAQVADAIKTPQT